MPERAMVPVERIVSRILTIRGRRVILDTDLARIYGVTTKALNQAVKHTARRFPGDFMFLLKRIEKEEVVTNCDHLFLLDPFKKEDEVPRESTSVALDRLI